MIPGRKSPWIWAGLAVVGAAALAWIFGAPLVFGPVVAVTPVLRADFVQTLVASGHVETPFRVTIGSQITGVVASIQVAEGQRVQAGDTLLTLDDSEARATTVQAEGQVAQAEARIRQIRELTLPSAEQSLVEATATLLSVQQAYERQKTLTANGNGSRAALEEATKNLRVARAQLRSAELQVFTNRVGGSDYVLAESQLSQAQATLAVARSRLSDYRIKTPRDGILIARDVEVGNVVQPGKQLMLVSPSGDAQIIVQIDERNLRLIALGLSALASADAYAKETFPAKIVYINPGVDLQRASVEVKLDVPAPPAYLSQDMTVSVDIEVARRPQALIVAAADIKDINGAHPWVLKAIDGHARRQAVSVGLVSSGKAEILSGLEVGDRVVSASAGPLTDGGPIRPRSSGDGGP